MSDTTPAINIDRKHYEAPKLDMTGAELRQLPRPPIGSDRDLWEEVPGGNDIRILDDTLVHLKDGMHFFSSPSTINPG